MKKVIIICGGIGGAGTAFALSRAGLEPVVYNSSANALYLSCLVGACDR